MTTLKELKELEVKATSAPWYGFFATFSRERMIAFSHVSNDECASVVATKNDYDLITATRNALPDLIRVIELVEEALDMAKDFKTNDIVRPKLLEAIEEIRKLKGE